MRRGAKVVVSWGSAAALVFCLVAPALMSQTPGKGNLIGFVFEKDGSTPVAGAAVVVKNVSTGAVVEGAGSDELGVFRFSGLDAGLYALGVRSGKGSYNSPDFFGVAPGATAKITIALDPFEDDVTAAAAAAVIKEQRDKGEAFIGKIVSYSPDTKEAEVLIEIGLIQADDPIHIKGQVTDFYQDTRLLTAYGAKAKRVLSGHTAVFRASKPCAPGDFVYIVCKRGVPPFFLAPLGVAAIVAGAVPLSAVYEEDVSRYKIK
jgi:hypothetical protein